MGGNFEKFFDRLDKNRKDASSSYNMRVRFGWVGVDCENGTSSGGKLLASDPIYFFPQSIGTNYEQGKIKFTIEGADLMVKTLEETEDEVYGSDDPEKAVSMRQAIIKMFEKRGITVKFQRMGASRVPEPIGFMPGTNPKPDGLPPGGSFGGAFSKYTALQHNPFKASLEWLKDVGTYPDNKPLKPGWDNSKEEPTLIFWEDTTPTCSCDYKPENSLGTWIVNGGNNSPVISFNPNIKWNVSIVGPLGGGNMPGSEGGAIENNEENVQKGCEKIQKGTGIQGQGGNGSNAVNQEGTEATKKSSERSGNLSRAWIPQNSIEVQLTVQGAPEFSSPLDIVIKTFGIIVVNPFHYTGSASSSSDCGDWLLEPIINSKFSNKGWNILAVNHQIKEGSFQTLFDLTLMVPGVNLNENTEYGCNGSGGGKLKK